MRFKNNGESVKLRKGNLKGYFWITVRHGEIVDLPEIIGKRDGFEKVTKSIQKVTEGKIGKTKVETKQFESTDFKKELIRIKGIGSKTASDIIKIYTKERLIKDIQLNKKLPFRDDVEEKLKEKYG